MCSRTRFFAVVAILALPFLAACGPSLKTPEEAGKAIAEKRIEQFPKEAERGIDFLEWDLDCDEKELEWWADRGSLRDAIDNKRAELEFVKDNLSKIKSDISYDVVDIDKGPAGKGKMVTVNVWRYDSEEVKKGSKLFYLAYKKKQKKFHLVDVGGKWKIKNKKD